MQEATGRVQATISGILERAKKEGAVAEEVTVDEFFLLVRGLAQAAATMPRHP